MLALIRDALCRAIAPPAKTTVSEWADANRKLSGPAAAEPGPWRTDRVPYTREIMDAFSNPAVHTVSWMAASQLAKSEILLNVAGYFIAIDPCSMMIVQDSLDRARDFSRTRLDPMIEDSPSLRDIVMEPKGRDPDNTTLRKTFRGGQVTIASAQTPGDLSSRPKRVILADELGRYENTKEGDPVALMRKRASNFWNKKFGFFSSPADKGTCRIEQQYNLGDRRKYWVPCPDCGHHQVLKHANVVWDKLHDEDGNLVLDANGKAVHLSETAGYACEKCGSVWTDAKRHLAVRCGEWRAERPFKGHASFWLSALYSPWVSLAEYVAEFLEAKKLPGTLKVFTNTFMGETWEETGETVDQDELYRRVRAENWSPTPTIPAGVAVITAAIDQQVDRLELEVIGWGRNKESWSLLWVQIFGDTLLPKVWEEADELLKTRFTTSDGRDLPIKAAVVDTGGQEGASDMAYAFCKKRWFRRVWAIKGDAKGFKNPVWPLSYSKRNKGNVPLFVINVDAGKKTVTDHLKIEVPGPGFVHFPADRPASYFRQFAAEKIVTRFKRGFPIKEWHQASGMPNEALDLHGYNYAALCGLERRLRLDLDRECDRIERRQKARRESAPAASRPAAPVALPPVRPADPYL